MYQAGIPAPGSGAVFAQNSVLQQPGQWQVFFTAPPAQTSNWLLLSKIAIDSSGATGSTSQSLDAAVQLSVKRPCSTQNCAGCSQLSVQLLCYNAQQCALANCIGSTVNINRPLCAIGMTLQATMNQYVAVRDGTWTVISGAMTDVLDLSGGITPPSAISWPDDAFYGYLCSTKDITATSISILMSAISGVVQASSQTPAAQANAATMLIDNKANALFTMSLASVTNFFYQLCLYPLYGMAAVQKTFACQTNSIMSVVDTSGASITIGDPTIESASSLAAGQCMSQYDSENTQGGGTGVANTSQSLASKALKTLESAAMGLYLDSMLHPLDATLTWMSGAISGLQDLVETLDRTDCVLPDFSAKDSFQCACGDTPFTIVPQRSNGTWENQAHWCSGTLSMLNYDGSTSIVWNPYSLDDLRTMMLKPPSGLSLDAYLDCVATTTGTCSPPADHVFVTQQVLPCSRDSTLQRASW